MQILFILLRLVVFLHTRMLVGATNIAPKAKKTLIVFNVFFATCLKEPQSLQCLPKPVAKNTIIYRVGRYIGLVFSVDSRISR